MPWGEWIAMRKDDVIPFHSQNSSSKPFQLDQTNQFSFRPKFLANLVEQIAPMKTMTILHTLTTCTCTYIETLLICLTGHQNL